MQLVHSTAQVNWAEDKKSNMVHIDMSNICEEHGCHENDW